MSAGTAPDGWPAHEHVTVPWAMSGRGPREDRMVRAITAAIPPSIAGLDYRPTRATAVHIDDATAAVAALDAGPGTRLAAIGGFLLRSESVSSSRIERVNASRDDFARALAGVRASQDARATVAAVSALTTMVGAAGSRRRIELADMLAAHADLMAADPQEKPYAGRLRDVQNWIGGSDYSPRTAIHVPPPAELVAALMADLVTYANRDDITTMAQAAIVHAQFESVHPFTDGNGRIGRALISAVIRRRGLATRTVVPIASAMLADTGRYFGLVNAYRDGAVDDFVDYVATSTVVAAEAAVQSAHDLAELPDQWRDLARPRGGSTAAVLIDLLLANPILDVRDVQNLTGSSYASANDALARLTETGVLALLTRRARDRVWMAPEVLDEVERMNERIGIRLPPSL